MPRMQVDSPETRRRARMQGERAAAKSLVMLLAAVSMLRTALTRVLPMAGSSGWWVIPVCLLPGLLSCALLAGVMRLTGAPTLQELVRRCLGRAGGWIGSALLALLLLTDGASSMTALITLFTEGIGTKGTQLTLALLTGGVLTFCLHREGLPRAVYLLRWVLLGSALLLWTLLLSAVHRDGLHPVLGQGREAVKAALLSGVQMGWPLLLLLTVPADEARSRLRSLVPSPAAVMVTVLLVCLTHPHELLIQLRGLPDGLLLPVRYAGNGIQVLGQCLLMLTFFLSIGGCAQLAGDLAARGRAVRWPAYAALLLITATQALTPDLVWHVLQRIEGWLVLLLGGLLTVCLLCALMRGKRM